MEFHSDSAIKERVGNAAWCKCFKCNVEKREIDLSVLSRGHSTERKSLTNFQ